jgi:hypothetical protein
VRLRGIHQTIGHHRSNLEFVVFACINLGFVTVLGLCVVMANRGFHSFSGETKDLGNEDNSLLEDARNVSRSGPA